MNKKMVLAAKVLVAIAASYFSFQLALTYWWYVGLVFGLVVILFDTRTPKEFFKTQHLQFLLASTAIFALVYWIAVTVQKGHTPFKLYGNLLGTAVGSILLPLAHKMFLSVSWKRVQVAIPVLYVSW
jgi:hypothetical protein